MTYALAGLCRRTGAVGACVATADLAVGARVPHVAADAGVVLTQHRTDPRLGPRGLDLLRRGADARVTVAELVASTEHARWRQLAVLDLSGATAVFSGAEVVTTMAEPQGDGCVAIGNVLRSPAVCDAMVAAFGRGAELSLGERLVQALEAGRDAGGEESPARSSVVLVAVDPGMSLVDLRVDDHEEPVGALRALWDTYAPWADEFRLRALNPDAASGIPSTLREDVDE